jgi:tetratricopeptide (TPR) repeat protein
MSDADGRFMLSGVADGSAILFVERAGFHFHGQPMAENGAELQLRLRPIDGPAASLPGSPPALSRDEELQLARYTFRPRLNRAFEQNDASERWDALRRWLRIDPADALTYLDEGKLAEASSDDRDVMRGWVAERLVSDSFEEATAIVESISDADRRVDALIELVGHLPPSQTVERRQLLDQALLDAGQAESAALRTIWLHAIADGLLDLGESDRARAVLDDARKMVAALPAAGEGAAARGYVAEVLARLDLEAALELAATIAEDESRDKTYGRIASRIAARQPAEAERALDLMRNVYRRDGFCVSVCSRSAPVDPERALRLAGRIISPYLRAYALGLMAQSAGDSKPVEARAWLEEAFALLARIADSREERMAEWRLSAAVVAGLLLPAAEKVDARLLSDYCWWAVSFRGPHSATDEVSVSESTGGLAMCLARYDHQTARLLAEPLIDDLVVGQSTEGTLGAAVAFYAACVIDPRWAAEIVGWVPESEGAERTRDARRGDLAWALGPPPEKRLRALFGDYLRLWWPDDPDNAFVSAY